MLDVFEVIGGVSGRTNFEVVLGNGNDVILRVGRSLLLLLWQLTCVPQNTASLICFLAVAQECQLETVFQSSQLPGLSEGL